MLLKNGKVKPEIPLKTGKENPETSLKDGKVKELQMAMVTSKIEVREEVEEVGVEEVKTKIGH